MDEVQAAKLRNRALELCRRRLQQRLSWARSLAQLGRWLLLLLVLELVRLGVTRHLHSRAEELSFGTLVAAANQGSDEASTAGQPNKRALAE